MLLEMLSLRGSRLTATIGKVVAIVLATSLSPFSFEGSLKGMTRSRSAFSGERTRGLVTEGFAPHIFFRRHDMQDKDIKYAEVQLT